MAEVAILIKTIYRLHSLVACLDSIFRYANVPYRIYIADDGPVSDMKALLYDSLRRGGHVVLELPFNTGASQGRNDLLKSLQGERYVLRMDDDFVLTNETDIALLRDILIYDPGLGAIADLERQIGPGKGAFSGEISPWQGYLWFKGDTLIKQFIPLRNFAYHELELGNRKASYAQCDFSRNFLLLKAELLESVSWDPDIKFQGEHLDFMLQIKESCFALAFSPDSTHDHRDDLNAIEPFEQDYQKLRASPTQATASSTLERKWGIRSVVNHNSRKTPLHDSAYRYIARIARGLHKVALWSRPKPN